MKKLSINIIANAVLGYKGLSGGDSIFINFAKELAKRGIEVNIFTWKHGYLMCRKNGLTKKKVNFFLSGAGKFEKWSFLPLYLLRTYLGIKRIEEVIKQGEFENKKAIIYSASDFYPDSLPGFFFKKWLPDGKWAAGFYLFAPNPLKGFRGEWKLKNFLFWFSQKPIFCLIAKFADLICVTSQPDVKPFVKKGRKKKEIFVVKGGIDYEYYRRWRRPTSKIYQAVFMGRLHPQKGVVEMIDIWRHVVDKYPKAKLAVIGEGPMKKEMEQRINQKKLQKNVSFFGFQLGEKRDRIIQKGLVILHPAVYDSGGMSAAHGLVCGLPGVSFDLPLFKTYYPRGFLRVKRGDFKGFAGKILSLLENPRLYQKMSREAIQEAKTWSWAERTEKFLQETKKL